MQTSSSSKIVAAVLGLFLSFALQSCRSAESAEDEGEVTTNAWQSAGESVGGRAIEYSVHGDGELVVLLIASIHGDETGGTPLLVRLHNELVAGASPELLIGRRIIIMPCANPDGYATSSRANANGIDLNRNFPASNFSERGRHGSEPLSEPESSVIHELIRSNNPDRIISFHMAAELIDYDGPAAGLARAAADASGLKVRRLGSRPGSLGSFFGLDLGRPILTIEQPASARRMSDADAWQTYSPLLRAVILY